VTTENKKSKRGKKERSGCGILDLVVKTDWGSWLLGPVDDEGKRERELHGVRPWGGPIIFLNPKGDE